MANQKKFDLEERQINFAAMICELVNTLPADRVGNHIGSQLIRSGTSPALNYGEVLGAESSKDFIHKMGIVLKELRESLNGLRILVKIKYVSQENPACRECDELVAIFVKSVVTAKKNQVS